MGWGLNTGHLFLNVENFCLLSSVHPQCIPCQSEKEDMNCLDSPDSYAKTASQKGHRQGEQRWLSIPFQNSDEQGCRTGTKSCCLGFKLKASQKQLVTVCLFLNPFTPSPVLVTYIILELSGPHDKCTNTLNNSPGPHPRMIGYICVGV